MRIIIIGLLFLECFSNPALAVTCVPRVGGKLYFTYEAGYGVGIYRSCSQGALSWIYTVETLDNTSIQQSISTAEGGGDALCRDRETAKLRAKNLLAELKDLGFCD